MDGRSNCTNNATFSNSSGVMCTEPEKLFFFLSLGNENARGLNFVQFWFSRILNKKKQRTF